MNEEGVSEINIERIQKEFKTHRSAIDFDEKFIPRRGRINCSLNDGGKWRWFGTQFTVQKN